MLCSKGQPSKKQPKKQHCGHSEIDTLFNEGKCLTLLCKSCEQHGCKAELLILFLVRTLREEKVNAENLIQEAQALEEEQPLRHPGPLLLVLRLLASLATATGIWKSPADRGP